MSGLRFARRARAASLLGLPTSLVPKVTWRWRFVESTTSKSTSLSNEEILRYSRHLIMPEVGMEGQLKLKNAKVLLIGTGGLGAPLGLYLAASGVGKLGRVDI